MDDYDLIMRARIACSNALRTCIQATAIQQRIAIRRGKTLNDLIRIQETNPPFTAPHCPYCGKENCTEHLDLEQELLNG